MGWMTVNLQEHKGSIYLQVSSETDGEKQHQDREGGTVRHSHFKITEVR